MQRQPRRRPSVSSRGEGIALLVVLVVFVILYLVVYQLHFSTTMEAKIAQVRYGEAESSSALHSVALYVMTLLVEDLKEDAGGGSAAGSAAGAGGEGPRAVGKEAGTPGPEGDGGTFTSLAPATGSSKWTDYLHENIFKDNRQQVGDITVKIRLVDGERAFDLNKLFDYPRLEGDAADESGIANVSEDELRGAVEGKSGEEAALSLRDKVMEKSRQRRAAGTEKAGAAGTKGGEEAAGMAVEGDPASGTAATAVAGEYEVEQPFEMPAPERIEATRAMLERAIEGMFSVNELNGFVFPSGIKYSASEMASSILQYVLERRQQPFQNRIYLVTELLNIPGITPEVFYGPLPFVPEGEELDMGTGFVLRRDDFGDLTSEYIFGDVDPQLLEQESLRLRELESQLGQFANLAEFGFDPMKANPLTRGMSEQVIDMDEQGNEYVKEKPFPIGLKDIFTTWSSGKINLNTAPYPVLYALLLSLSDGPGGDANLVALDICDYRNRFQEEVEEEGVERVGGSDEKSAPDLGQPKRQKKDEATSASAKDASAASLDSLAGMDAAALDELSAYQDVETNYFTSLDQLELVDGTEGDASDRLRKDEGVERVDVEQDTLLRRAQHDLGGCVFGSTHFNAELRAKPRSGGAVKVGHLSLRRDTKKKMVEVLMWKNFQK